MKKKVVEQDLDNKSMDSEISINTNEKVFRGAFDKLAEHNLKLELKEKNLVKVDLKNDKKIEKKKPNLNIKLEENPNPAPSNRLNSPVSFRTNIKNELEKITKTEFKIEMNNIKEEYDEDDEPKFENSPEAKLRKSIANEIKTLSIRNKSGNKILEAKENYETHKDSEKIKNIINQSESYDEEDSTNTENIFWNLNTESRKIIENSSNIKKAKTLNLKTNNSKINQNTLEDLPKSHSYKSKILCTISKIDRGIAVMVSSDDVIFNLPYCFLPKNSVAGNSIHLSLESGIDFNTKLNNISQLQLKFI